MLNPKQERFCVEYVKSGNATESYCIAYGVENNASTRATSSKLLTNPNVVKRIDELRKEIHQDNILSIEEMQIYLTGIILGNCKDVHVTKEGIVSNIPPYMKDRLKAIELLGKMKGAFTDNVRLSGSISVPQIIDDIPCDQNE